MSIEQQLNGAATVSVTRVAPFTGAVAVTFTGLPAGVTVAPSPVSIASGATSTPITLTVGAAVPTGSYPVTIRGSASGVPDATTTLIVPSNMTEVSALIGSAMKMVQTGKSGAAT